MRSFQPLASHGTHGCEALEAFQTRLMEAEPLPISRACGATRSTSDSGCRSPALCLLQVFNTRHPELNAPWARQETLEGAVGAEGNEGREGRRVQSLLYVANCSFQTWGQDELLNRGMKKTMLRMESASHTQELIRRHRPNV